MNDDERELIENFNVLVVILFICLFVFTAMRLRDYRRICKLVNTLSLRYYSAGRSHTPNVCIVGAGPAGFYTAQQILKV